MHVTVNLQWEPSKESQLVGYKIHWGAQDTPFSSLTVPQDVTSLILVADLHPMRRYSFLVSSYDGSGNESAKRVLTSVFPVSLWRDDGWTLPVCGPHAACGIYRRMAQKRL